MSLQYYEDMKPHQKRKSRGYHLTEKEIIDFASVWEPRPIHVNPEFAKNGPFGSVIATGNHIISITFRLLYDISIDTDPPQAIVVGLSLDRVQFKSPARPGDVLVVESEVTSKRKLKTNETVGIVRYAIVLHNQRDEVVFSCMIRALVSKRPQM